MSSATKKRIKTVFLSMVSKNEVLTVSNLSEFSGISRKTIVGHYGTNFTQGITDYIFLEIIQGIEERIQM